jgi:hypothetical protein
VRRAYARLRFGLKAGETFEPESVARHQLIDLDDAAGNPARCQELRSTRRWHYLGSRETATIRLAEGPVEVFTSDAAIPK